MSKKPLAFKIEPCPTGYQVSWSRGNDVWSSKRFKFLWRAKYFVWSYRRRDRKEIKL